MLKTEQEISEIKLAILLCGERILGIHPMGPCLPRWTGGVPPGGTRFALRGGGTHNPTVRVDASTVLVATTGEIAVDHRFHPLQSWREAAAVLGRTRRELPGAGAAGSGTTGSGAAGATSAGLSGGSHIGRG